MFSIAYVLQRYVFTRLGIILMGTLALAVWAAGSFQRQSGGVAANSEGELIVLSWALLVLFAWAISVLIGAIIDGKRGALWGLLGPVGWIIAAIGRLEARNPPKTLPRAEHASKSHADSGPDGWTASYDVKKWFILKEVDPEIKAASDRVCAINPELEAILADKYLRLSQKEYLEPLVAKLISDATNEKDRREQSSLSFEPGIYETSGPFRFRILPDHSISVFSDPSGTMSAYERFKNIDVFLDANHSRGARREAMTKLD